MSEMLDSLSILFLEDSQQDLELVEQKLNDEFDCPIRFDRAETEQEFIRLVSNHCYDIILSDYTLPGYNALSALKQVQASCPSVPFICVSGTIGEDLAVELLKQGGTDYVLKDRLGRLSFVILRALEAAKSKEAARIALQEQENFKRLLEEAQRVANIGSWELDLQNNRVFWSDEAYRILGLEPKTTVLHRDILYTNMIEEDKQRVADAFTAAIRDRNPFDIDFAIILPEGIQSFVRTHGNVQYDREGNITQIIGIFQDVTEHKLMELEANRINRNLEEAQRIAHIGSWEWNHKTGSIYWSDEMYCIFRLDPGTFNLSYESAFSLVHPDDKGTVYQTAYEAIKDRKPFTIEHRLLLADGTVRHVLTHGLASYDKDGNLETQNGTIQDITERKQQEEALQKLIESNRLLLDSTSEGIAMFDGNGTILNMNKTFLGRYSVPMDTAVGIRYIELVPHEKYGNLAQERFDKLRKVYESGEPMTFEDIRDGRIYSNRMYPVLSNNKVCAVTLFSVDVTDHTRANEEEVRRLQSEARLNVMTEFFTNVSHELRTPLSLILMQMDMMRMYLGNEKKMAEILDAVTLNSYRLTRLVSNLLDITKMDSGFMTVNLRSRDIVGILRSICDSVYDYARAKSIELVFYTDVALKQVDLDREKIDRVILNLLSNAIKHTPPGGRITVELRDMQSTVQICVRDTGEGIPADKLQTVFERFAQLSSERSKPSEGCGIGLALVKSLTELHRGRVWVQSRLGEGSAFYVELPVEIRDVQKNFIAVEGFDLKKKVEMELSDLYIRV